MEQIINIITKEFGLVLRNVKNTVNLLEEGATVPFISRYRKEMTGSMDEVTIAAIAERVAELKEIAKRREYVISVIESQNALTDELRQRLEQSWDKTEIEDIYLPFKPKRRTRAEVARQLGLEPLAKVIMSQNGRPIDARRWVKGDVKDEEQAINGAKDIIAEWVSEDSRSRTRLRRNFSRTAIISSRVVKGKEWEGQKYRDWFDFSEPLRRCPAHRLLAMRRGEDEGVLKVSITPADDAEEQIARLYVKSSGEASEYVAQAVHDAYKRLLLPSIENEFAAESKRVADAEAISIFTRNLRQLLLTSPLGRKRVLAIDPGFRTGCKVVCLSEQGDLLEHSTIYPHATDQERVVARYEIEEMVERHEIQAIAIGRGTAGRETKDFIDSLRLSGIAVHMVNEDGASVYSASEVAREEFPDKDVTVRGAVSIGRRLIDPLAELVKIDPKSIGVGQYQHDVDQTMLRKGLDQTVESCVNSVGVNLNTASKELLSYVSGIGPQLARRIVDYRLANGPFCNRQSLKQVPRLGAKAFEQSAAFLRIPGSDDPLDNSAVHPERYALVRKMASDCGCSVSDLMKDSAMRQGIDIKRYVGGDVGMETLTDIMAELERPGRDPRGVLEDFDFDASIRSIDDLKEGMVLKGIVTNITAFGCFVDLGIKTKGLIHLSQMADRYIKDPNEVVSVGQNLTVKVIGVDHERSRISLSLKGM
ncbi:MAG: RNA-binding transcriptional accessory protein [Muribaculaceae bacterium]|nr:RNA-binding transcriptional accessory protein [Muribaculaceae bacterium]